MPTFLHDDVEIAYLDESPDSGAGAPIVLIHGFASSKTVNWVYPTWVSELKKHGKRVIALDNRGHGDSRKLYDTAAYGVATMAQDVRALMDHLDIARADIMGYSLGARIAATLALAAPDRVARVILGGLGMTLIRGGGPGENVALALEADDPSTITDPMGKTFRAFADQTRSDRRALAACLRGSRDLMSEAEAASIACPVLIAVGTKDDVSGSGAQLQAIVPGSQLLDIPHRDHMRAVGDRVYKQGVLDFLGRD